MTDDPLSERDIRAHRIKSLLLRHSRPDDLYLTDRDFVQAIIDRWQHDRAAELVDVNE